MTNEAATTAPVATESGAEKAGNISVDGLVAFLNRENPEAEAAKPAEAEAAAPATPAEETPPAEAPPEAEATAETPPAQEAETPPELDPETEEVLSQSADDHDAELRARLAKIISKRLGKEKSKLSALEAQLAEANKAREAAAAKADELTKAVAQAQPVPAYNAAPNDPLAKVNTLAELESEYRKARGIVEQAEEMLDNGVPEEGVQIGGQTFTEKDLKEIRRNAKRTVEDAIPARARYLQAKAQWDAKAVEEFSYLKDANSPDYVKHMAAFNTLPMLHALPNAHFIVGAVLDYQKRSEAAKTKPAAPAATPKPKAPASQVAASAPPAGKTREASDVGKRREADAKRSALLRKGNMSREDAAAYFMAS